MKIIGNFAKGLSCILLKSSSIGQKWTICGEESKSIIDLASAIKRLVIANQRRLGKVIINQNEIRKKELEEKKKILKENAEDSKLMKEFEKKSGSSYWILLQSWSSCSLSCGGGTQTMHRKCVKPSTDSPPCKGTETIERKCNIQPCPSVVQLENKKNKEKQMTANPIVKIMPFSSRPQQYIVSHLFFNPRNVY